MYQDNKNNKPEFLLIFPPAAMRMLAPEIGLPVLAGFLKKNGINSHIIDLNAIMLFDWLSSEEAQKILKHRWEGRSENFRSKYTDYEYSFEKIKYAEESLQGYAQKFTPLINPECISWDIRDFVKTAFMPDTLFEAVYSKFIRPVAEKTDIAGFSILNCYQLPASLYFARRIKQDFPKIRTVFGGPWVSASESVLHKWECLFRIADYVCLYAGELPLLGLAEFLMGKTKIENVPGIVWHDGKTVRRNRIIPPPELKNLPLPLFDDMPLNLYPRRKLAVRNSSGCVYGKCSFCYHCFPNNRYTERNPDETVDEMMALAEKYGINEFEFADYSIPPQMLMKISQIILRRGFRAKWNALTRADYPYSYNFAKLLSLAGCQELFVGAEISSQRERERLGKGIREGVLEQMAESCIKAGIRLTAFLLNYPGISWEMIEESLAYYDRLKKESGGKFDYIIADFELGRASNAMRNLDLFDISLPENVDMDARSFNLPFISSKPWKRIYPE